MSGAFLAIAAAALATVKIGLMSDTHVGCAGAGERLEQSYRLFKAHRVDRILNLGDICESYKPKFFAEYAVIRAKVYPEGSPPETYVYACHDRMGAPRRAGEAKDGYAETFAEVKRMLGIPNGLYDRFECGGFTFLVYPQAGDFARMEREIAAECAAHPGRPLFVLDHVPPSGTVAGSVNGGERATRAIFDRHPEVVALSGHVHGSIVHEGKIWQGGFTAIGLGTSQALPHKEGACHVAIMELSKDCEVIRRYDIRTGEELHPEAPWTLTFPFNPTNAPYAPARRAAKAVRPDFADDAVARTVKKGRMLESVRLEFPAAVTPDIAHYDISLETRTDRGWVERTRVRQGADYTVAVAKRKKTFSRSFSSAYFNPGEVVRFRVCAVDFFGNRSRALETSLTVGEVEKWETLFDGAPAGVKLGEWCTVSGDVWFKLPKGIFRNVPPCTACRLVLDVDLDLPATDMASFNLRQREKPLYCFGYIRTPVGRTSLRYVADFGCLFENQADYHLLLSRAAEGRVRFRTIRIECNREAKPLPARRFRAAAKLVNPKKQVNGKKDK